MSDVAIQATQVVPALIGAAGGGLGVVWIARFLLTRMINGYDKRHDEQAKKLERVAERFDEALGDLKTKVAVVEAVINDARTVRTDTQTAVQGVSNTLAHLRAEVAASLKAMRSEVNCLADDVFVAHRRLELLAHGDNDISKVQKTNLRRKPT